MNKIIKKITILICLFLLIFPITIPLFQSVNANKISNIEYRYVSIDELEEQEKSTITYDTPKNNESGIYYLIYSKNDKNTVDTNQNLSTNTEKIDNNIIDKTDEDLTPKNQENILSKTGITTNVFIEILFMLLLIAISIIIYKKGKSKSIIIFIIFVLGSILSANNSYAIKEGILSSYNQIFKLNETDKLPEPKKIEDYSYVGYIYKVVEENQTSDNKKDDKQDDKKSDEQTAKVTTEVKENILSFKDLDKKYEVDPELEKGKTRTIEGKDGKEIITYEVTYLDDKEIKREEIDRKREEPTPTIIYTGTKETQTPTEEPKEQPKDVIEEKETTETLLVKYEEKVVLDNTLLVGEEVVVGGEEGIIENTYKEKYVNGELKSKNLIATKIVKNPVDKTIRRGTTLKDKPVVTIENVVKKDTQNSIVVNYLLTDNHNTYKKAVARIYKGETLVKEVEIPTLTKEAIDENLLINDLEKNVEYELKTYLTYDRGNGEESTIEESTYPFTLEDKKIELKRVKEIALYNDNEKIINLKEIPTDLTNYYAKISIDGLEDIILSINNVEETEKDGQKVYKVTAKMPKLSQELNSSYKDGYTFYMPKNYSNENTYDDFSKLIADIRKNPSGTFVLGSDLVVKDSDLIIEENGVQRQLAHYFDGTFTGTLIGANNNQKFAIYGLKAPLFKEATNATIREIDFKDVNIDSTATQIGTVAGIITTTTLEDVAVSGSLRGPGNIGGIVSRVTQKSRLTNVSFNGNIEVTRDADNYSGGIAGAVNSASTIERAYANVNMTGRATDGGRRLAGLVGGLVANATLKNSYVEGTITNIGNTKGQVAGITGSLWTQGIVNNVISFAKVINGNRINGDRGDIHANVTNSFYVQGYAEGDADVLRRTPLEITKEEANEKIASFNITATTTDTDFNKIIENTDYTNVEGYQADRERVYRNIEKLLPYYIKQIIVENGNKIPETSNIYTKDIVSTSLLVNNNPIYDLPTNKEKATNLLIRYNNGTVDILEVKYNKQFEGTDIQEYLLPQLNILYTPKQLSKTYNEEIDTLVNELVNMDYMSVVKTLRPNYQYFFYQMASQAVALGLTTPRPTAAENIEIAKQSLIDANVDPYYLKQAFDANKDNMKKHIISMLENDSLIDTTGKINPTQRLDYIRQNKEKILLGLAYMTRWYNIDINGANLADLTIYHRHLFGDKQSSIDFLKNVGAIEIPSDINQDMLMSHNTPRFYKNYLANKFGQPSISAYLEYYKNIFVGTKSMNDWFKETSKATIHEEQPSLSELQHVDVSIWGVLNKNSRNEEMILPLLTMRHKGLSISLTMNTMVLSPFEKYHLPPASGHYDDATDIIEDIKRLSAQSAKNMRMNAEMWYRILPENKRDELYNLDKTPILSFDGFNVMTSSGKSRVWSVATMEGEAPKPNDKVVYAGYATKDFFGPIREYRVSNGLEAYADGVNIWYINGSIFTKYGSSIMTHELVHNMDGGTYFLGHDRRRGMGPEDFATGMLQSINNIKTDESIGFNTDVDYNTYDNGSYVTGRLHNVTPERFQTADDLQTYFKRTYDVLYMLSYAEAEEMLKLNKDDLRYLINKVDKIADGEHNKEEFRPYTDEEWAAASFNTINDLIDNNAIVGRVNGKTRAPLQVARNTYQTENRFYANYGTYTTDKGGPGSRSFKQNSFELWAAGGYDAYINYVSNKLHASAVADQTVLSDRYILNKTFNGQYETYNDFRKAMYAERYAKRSQLKPFVYNGVTYNTYEDMKTLLANAIQQDLAKAKAAKPDYSSSNVKNLKREIFRYYINETDDFRSSIYSE